MSLGRRDLNAALDRFPRVSEDEPVILAAVAALITFSLRERG